MSCVEGVVMMKPLLIAGVLMAAGVGAGAQSEHEAHEPQEAREADELSASPPFEFAGFTVPGLGEGVDLRFRENANGVMYGVDISRADPADPHRYADVTPLARFSQTIGPVAQMGTIDDLLAAVVTDAQRVMRGSGLNDSFGEAAPCSREIMGERRTGKRFDAVLSHDPLMSPEPIRGHVECYAFGMGDKGVSVFIRVAESDERAREDDARDLAALLAGVGFKPVSPVSPYTYDLGGYPIGLPVGSRVMSVEQPNDSTMTARVTLDSVSLSVMLMRLPEQYAPEEGFARVEGSYEDQIRASIARSKGTLRLLWKSGSAIPAGRDHEGLIDAPVYMLASKGGRVYSAFYKNMEGGMLLSGVFTASPANADKLHADARVFVDAFRGNRYDLGSDAWTVRLPGRRVRTAPSLRAVAMRDGSGAIEATLLGVGPGTDAEGVFRSLLTHHAFTVVRSAPLAGTDDLRDWHGRLVGRVAALGGGEAVGDPEIVEDGDWVASRLTLTLGVEGGDDDPAAPAPRGVDLTVRTRGVDGVVISAISPEVLAPDAGAMAERLGGMIEPAAAPGRLGLPFGTLVFEPGSMLVTRARDERRGESHAWFMAGTDRVDVFTTDPDSTQDVLSDRFLAERYMHPQWKLLAYDDEEGLYPRQGEGLDRVTIAGHEGRGLAVRLPGADEEPGRKRNRPIGAGVFGFRHGDRYTTIVIKQLGAYRRDRFDEILGMFEDGQ